MMRNLSVIAAACAVASGCATVAPPDPWPSHHDLSQPLAMPDGFPERFQAEQTATPARSEAERRSLRREMSRRLISESNGRCEQYMTQVSVTRNASRGVLDVMGLTFSSVGAVASPNSANWWAGASSLSQSTRSSLEQTVFHGAEFPTLYAAIGQGRRAWRDAFFADLEAGKMDNWQGDSILAEIQDYDLLCGINYGVARVQRAVQTQPTEQAQSQR